MIEDVADGADIEEVFLQLQDEADGVEHLQISNSSQPSLSSHAFKSFKWGCFAFTPKLMWTGLVQLCLLGKFLVRSIDDLHTPVARHRKVFKTWRSPTLSFGV